MDPPFVSLRPPKTYTLDHNGNRFKCEQWKVPDTSSYKGKIICVHGIGEDSTVYSKLFEIVLNQGYEVFFYAQRLKLTDKTTVLESLLEAPKDLLHDEHEANNFVDMSDLDFMIKHNLESRVHKLEKLYLLGNGQGSSLMLCYAMMGKHQDWIKAIVCYSPIVRYHKKSEPGPVIRLLTPVLSKYVPNTRVLHKVNMNFMTHEPSWTKYFCTVLYKHRLRVPVSQYNKVLIRCNALRTKSFVSRFNPDISIFIAQGDENMISDWRGTLEFYRLLNDNIQKEFWVVKTGKHMLLLELDALFDAVLGKTIEFMNKHIADVYGSIYNSL